MHLMSGGNTVDMVYLDFAKEIGTVLGPLLFLILMGDINSGISSSSIVSFADDTRLFQMLMTAPFYNMI